MKKILFIGMPFSIHTIRWINQINEAGNELLLFPSMKYIDLHCDLKPSVTYISDHYNILNFKDVKAKKIKSINSITGNISFENKTLNRIYGAVMRKIGIDKSHKTDLIKVIEYYKPDIIHSFETQQAGYLIESVIGHLNYRPFWIHSLWGSDIFYFANFSDHSQKIKSILKNIDLLVTEGNRDSALSKELGYQGEIKKIQATGGMDLSVFSENAILPSKRRNLILRGTQDLVRRGLVGLRAFERCIDQWKEYTLNIYSLTDDVWHASNILANKFPGRIKIHKQLNRQEFIQLLSTSRISVSVSRSDGMPNTMLESMAVGAFPIQSDSSCASDVINSHKNGILIPSDDPDIIEQAICAALKNDELVDKAMVINREIIEKDYNFNDLNKIINSLYL